MQIKHIASKNNLCGNFLFITNLPGNNYFFNHDILAWQKKVILNIKSAILSVVCIIHKSIYIYTLLLGTEYIKFVFPFELCSAIPIYSVDEFITCIPSNSLLLPERFIPTLSLYVRVDALTS